MNKYRLFWSFFLVCGFMILVSLAIANEHVYFLVDKSNSMWAHKNKDNIHEKNALDYAKQRVYDNIKANPPIKGQTSIFLYLFDSKLLNYRREIHSLQDAKDILKNIKPGGFTTIGDRLEDVRTRILKSGVKNVEIHLLSDMQESIKGKISKDEAIKRLDKMMGVDSKHNIGVKLVAYTWKNVLQQPIIPSNNVEFRSLPQQSIRASIEPISEIVMELNESQGQYDSVNDGKINLHGFFDKQFHKSNTNFFLRAYIEEMQDVHISLNGQNEIEIGSFANTKGILKIPVQIQIQNIQTFLKYSSKPNFLENEYQLTFEPTLRNIDSKLENIFTIDKPSKRKCKLTFTIQPYLYIKNYPVGKNLFRTDLTEGTSIKEPIVLAWNNGAVGKYLEWGELPKSGNMYGYFTLPNGKNLSPFQLDSALCRTIIFNMDDIKSLSNQSLELNIRGSNTSRKIPIIIETNPLALNLNRKHISQHLFENSEKTIEAALIIEPNALKMPYPVDLSLQLAGCKGSACKGLKTKLIDQTNPNFEISDISQSLRIDSPIWFDLWVKTASTGKANLELIAKSSKPVIYDENTYYKKKKFIVNLEVRSKKEISVTFDPIDAIYFSVLEKNGSFTGLKDQCINIRGAVSPEFLQQNKNLSLIAKIKELPDIPILLNQKKSLNCMPFINKGTGFLDIKQLTLKPKGYQLDNLLRSKANSALGKNYTLLFIPEISPQPTEQEKQIYTFSIPKSIQTTANFECKPLIDVNISKIEKKLYIGDDISIPIIVKWNLCLLDKKITWRMPRKDVAEDIWITDSNGKRIKNYNLNASLEEHFTFHVKKIKQSIKNQLLKIQVLNMNYNNEIAMNIDAERPHITITAKTKINKILHNKPINIPGAIVLSSNLKQKTYPFQVSILECEGNICDDIEFSLFDELYPDSKISLNGRSLPVNIKQDKRFHFKIQSAKSGNAKFTINFLAKDNIFFDNQTYTQQVRKVFDLNILIPQITWKALIKENNTQIGTQTSPITFITYGKDQTTKEDGLDVSAKFNADIDQLDFLSVKLSFVSIKGKPIVKSAVFNATGSDTCPIKKFLNNPNITLMIDKSQKGWISAVKQFGRIVITYIPEKYNINNDVNIYCRVKLER